MTDGALAAFDAGIVTACSVVAAGSDLDRAAAALRERPALDAGVHLVLAGGPLIGEPRDLPTLAPAGRPLSGHRPFMTRLALRRLDLGEIERELRCQIERAVEAGIRPAHLDGHQHLHVAPGLVSIVARLAREFDIGYVRVPLERVAPTGPRPLSIWGLGHLARRARRIFRAAGIATNDRAAGLVHAGHLAGGPLSRALDGIEGLTELVAHPGVGNGQIARLWPWGYDWDGEREALSRSGLREELERRGVRLIGTREAARLTARS